MSSDAEGVGVDDLPSFLRARWEVVEPHLRDIHDNAHMRRVRQHELRGDYDSASVAGHPHVHSRVGALDLVVADIKAASDVRQGILRRGPGDLHLTDDLII
jgi:hypothetical protein